MKFKEPEIKGALGSLRKSQSGYTLLEIMAVVVIIGLIVTGAIVNINNRVKEARINTANSTIKATIRTALNLYEMDNGTFPTTEQGIKALIEKPSSEPAPQNWKAYLENKTVPLDPWGREYIYVCPGSHNQDSYDLSSRGFNPSSSEDDITNW